MNTPEGWFEFRQHGASVWATGGRVERVRVSLAMDLPLVTAEELAALAVGLGTFVLSMVVGAAVAGFVR